MTTRHPVAVSLTLLAAAACAAHEASPRPPIAHVRARSFRTSDVFVEFDDAAGRHYDYHLNLHFMNGDGRVHGADGPIGDRAEREFLAALTEWVDRNISDATRADLATVPGGEWSPELRQAHEVLSALEKLETMVGHRR